MKYKRIVIKLSGESLASNESVFSISTIIDVAKQITYLQKKGVQVAIVVGGGNLWRGQQNRNHQFNRVSSDYIGMIGTVLNGLILQQLLENVFQTQTRVISAFEIGKITENYNQQRTIDHLEASRVVIFVGGIGSPYFTTDSTAALRACEINAQAILMAKNGIDGVYNKDPRIYNDAIRYNQLSYQKIFDQNLKFMDKTAATMCADNDIKIVVFDANVPDNIIKASTEKAIGTIISKKGREEC